MSHRPLLSALLTSLVAFSLGCKDSNTEPAKEQFTATLNGANEKPTAINSNATGTATFTNNADGTVTFTLNATNLTGATAAHIHGPADSNTAVGVLVTLFAAAAPGVNVTNGVLSSGTFPSSSFTIKTGVTVDSVLTLLRNGHAYVNYHTVTNAAGEIRGQVVTR